MFEIQPHRAAFAKQYCADDAFVNPPRNPGETTENYSTRVAKHILESVPGLARGFDVVIEAAGAEECMQIGIQVCKPGGTCKWERSSAAMAAAFTNTECRYPGGHI